MKKILALLLVVFSLVLVGCQDDKTNGEDKTQGGNEQQTPAVTVDSVSLKMQDGTDLPTQVFDGSTVRLAAEVKGSEAGLKVVWETSDASLAKVTNGVVKFGQVKEDTQVTVSAVSKDDNTKKASHTFTIKHCVLNLADSKGNIDDSLFMEEGTVTVENGDVGLVFSDVNHTKFYVEATIQIDTQDETDAYPKFGIMVGNDSMAGWNTDPTVPVKNAFYYCDTQLAGASSGWQAFNFVTSNGDFNDWDWGAQKGGFSVSAENKWNMYEGYTIGLLRDGVNYYLFAKDGEGLKCYKHVVYEGIAADEATYAWIGGWKTGVTVSNIKALVGDEADAMYAEVGALTIANTTPLLFIGTTHQIDVAADVLNFDLSKVSYSSDNEAIATVDANGLVTASQTPGTATITVKYGELSKAVVVTVTDDLKVSVVLDGKMDDALWTEEVKANKLVFNRDSGDVLINVYASRNSLGVYFFMEYQSTEDLVSRNDWWTGNNIELRVNGINGKLQNKHEIEANTGNNNQWWASTAKGGCSNFAGHYMSAPKLNDATGMYDIVFELFISYESMFVEKDALIGFSIGSNDGGGKWYCSANFDTSNFMQSFKVHEGGIGTPYYPESFCGENHEYGEFKVEKQASCAGDGEQAKYCKWCNHRVAETIAKGDHSYDDNKLVVDTVATCMAEGAGHIDCNGGCGMVKNVVIPRDLYNHVNCEKEDLNVTANVDRWTAGGWGDQNTWTHLAYDLTGDFQVVTTYKLNADIAGGWWRGTLPIVQHQLPEGAGSVWVTRFDWWGWCDQWDSSEKLTNNFNDMAETAGNRDIWWTNSEGGNVTEAQFLATMSDSTVEWTCTRMGSVMRNDFKFTTASGEVFTYWTVAPDVNPEKTISLHLSSEFAKYEVLSVVKHK